MATIHGSDILRRLGALVLSLSLALAPMRSDAIAPALLFMLKQIAQNVAKSMLKDALLSGLTGMGCKGIALANALEALDRRGGFGGAGALGGAMGGLGAMGAMGGLGGIGALSKMPAGVPGLPAGMPNPIALAGLPATGVLSSMPNMASLPPGLAPDQMAMMASLLQAMGEPLSPAATIVTIDELADLGFLPRVVQTELKECMVLVPASIPTLGMGMGMLKPIVPQLRQARAEMLALSPEEQDEVAAALAEEVAPLPAEQRAEFVDALGSGFFPPRVSAGVKRRLEVK